MSTSTRTGLLVGALLAAAAVPPSAGPERADAPTWAFEHARDRFSDQAVLDLRSLNEKEAGASGFLKRSADSSGFELGDGTPVRIWAVGSDLFSHGSRQDMAHHARFLAKLGVNMVRVHTQINPGTKGSGLTDVDQKLIDHIWQFVAAMKKEGIYVTISPYWATGRDVTRWGIEGYTGQTDLWGLLFFDEKLQEGYKAWARALYEPKNPYTGIPLAKEPAIGLIQVQNEDSLFFWTQQGIKPPQRDRLGKKFGAWLTAKYGSLEKAKQAWGGADEGKDDFATDKVAILDVWHMTQPRQGAAAARLRDQTEFMAQTQRDFYKDIGDFYRNQLGCKQLLNASNWVTADPVRLNDVERWTYAALDVLAVNRYTGGVHAGENNGWRIDPGHHFTNQSCLLDPRALPVNLKQVVGHPMVVTESTWVTPELYQSEGPFLVSAYQSLTGVAGFYWFAATTPGYDTDPRFKFANINGQNPLFKWSCSTPTLMGQFPAAALLYRKGYLRRGEPVVHEERTVADLWDRKVPLIAEDRSFDPNRYEGATGGERSNVKGGADPLAFLVGRVEVKYGGDPAKTKVADLTRYIDQEHKVVRSVTDEIKLDYGRGVCTVDTPKAQGACGFLSRVPEVKLGDVTIRSGNDYASVTLVSLDDRPIRSSGKVLVQTGTTARMSGWQARPARFKEDKQTLQGFEVVRTGQPPWRVVETDVTLVVNNPGITSATLLDTAGYRAKKVEGQSADGKFTIKLPANTMYLVLESAAP